ncbi:LysR family transcriptional regulator [Microbaculum marinum]|uniref:LysR family transcriptional regulator n=1 Tax=Microbaculum marinum TaxID=1764581 RepID=A0AAW9RQM6_9HYPH
MVRALKYFITTAELGSFRQAALVLRRKQSTVSRGIRRLEDDLGVSLFERGPNGVRLTDAGNSFLAQVLPAFEQLQEATKGAAAAGRGELGIVRIGTLTSLIGGFLHELIRQYTVSNAGVAIDLINGSRQELLAGVRARRLDIAFVTWLGEVHDCDVVHLWRERIYVAMPKNHRLAAFAEIDWPDLAGERFIVGRSPPGPEVRDFIVQRTFGRAPSVTIEFRAGSTQDLVRLVALGQGITLVSEAWEKVELPGLVLCPLCDEADILPFYAVWLPQNDNPALRRFLSVAHVLAGRVRRGSSDWASPRAAFGGRFSQSR